MLQQQVRHNMTGLFDCFTSFSKRGSRRNGFKENIIKRERTGKAHRHPAGFLTLPTEVD